MGTKAPQMVYGVIVCRTDGEHIIAMEDPNYDKCFKRWEELHNQWTAATKEQHPFVMTAPVVTAFSPAMVYEVKLVPINQENAANANNPYYQAMHEKGLSRTFPSRDLLG